MKHHKKNTKCTADPRQSSTIAIITNKKEPGPSGTSFLPLKSVARRLRGALPEAKQVPEDGIQGTHWLSIKETRLVQHTWRLPFPSGQAEWRARVSTWCPAPEGGPVFRRSHRMGN